MSRSRICLIVIGTTLLAVLVAAVIATPLILSARVDEVKSTLANRNNDVQQLREQLLSHNITPRVSAPPPIPGQTGGQGPAGRDGRDGRTVVGARGDTGPMSTITPSPGARGDTGPMSTITPSPGARGDTGPMSTITPSPGAQGSPGPDDCTWTPDKFDPTSYVCTSPSPSPSP
jgi:hypothetical protein